MRLLSLSSTRRISSPGMGAHGKGEREGRSAPHLALHPQAAAVELDELSRQREAETGALALVRGVAHLAELLEDRLLVLRRDADPGVGDRHLDGAVRGQRTHVDPAALGGELHGVGQQIQEDLLELALVGDNVRERLVDRQLEREPVAHGDRKSTRLNSSHGYISYAVFCLKKKTTITHTLLFYQKIKTKIDTQAH